MAFTSLILDTSTGSVTSGMSSYLSDLSKTIGVDLFEEDIDNVVFQTNEFLCNADFIGSQGPFWWILQMCMALGALFSIIVAGSMSYKMLVKGEPIDVIKIMKILGIALVARLGGQLCRDAGESALAAGLETAGGVCSMLAALPLLERALSLLEELMRG